MCCITVKAQAEFLTPTIINFQVLEGWRLILGGGGMNISLEQVQIHAVDNLAFVTCIEVMQSSNAVGRCILEDQL